MVPTSLHSSHVSFSCFAGMKLCVRCVCPMHRLFEINHFQGTSVTDKHDKFNNKECDKYKYGLSSNKPEQMLKAAERKSWRNINLPVIPCPKKFVVKNDIFTSRVFQQTVYFTKPNWVHHTSILANDVNSDNQQKRKNKCFFVLHMTSFLHTQDCTECLHLQIAFLSYWSTVPDVLMLLLVHINKTRYKVLRWEKNLFQASSKTTVLVHFHLKKQNTTVLSKH